MSLWHTREKMGEGQDDCRSAEYEASVPDGWLWYQWSVDNFHPSKCPQCSMAPYWPTILHLKVCIFPCCFPFSFPNTYTEVPLQGWFAWFRDGLCNRNTLNRTASLVCVNLIENDKIRRNTEMRVTASALSSIDTSMIINKYILKRKCGSNF